MVFIALNIFISSAFCFFTYYLDKILRKENQESSVLVSSFLIICAESILFTIALIFNKTWSSGFISKILNLVNFVDVFFWVIFSIELIGLATSIDKKRVKIVKYLLIILGVVLVYTKFDNIIITRDYSYQVSSKQVFNRPATEFFPWTWYELYQLIYHFLIPGICYIFLVLFQERNCTSLQRYQGLVIGESLLIFWGLNLLKDYLSLSLLGFTTLYLVPSVFMISLIIVALKKKNMPSGATIITGSIKIILSYILPALVVGFLVMTTQPIGKNSITSSFIFLFSIIATVAVVVSYKISNLLSLSARLYTSDYGPSLEKDLASVDYNDEMDSITDRMYQIFRRNVQSSSVNVYITNPQGKLEIAYSSNDTKYEISLENTIFDNLLNVNHSVVCYYEVGKIHDLFPIEKQLDQFFNESKTDALFILNEGRNILGLITLGKKVNGDHYKEYDINVFNKLYSYFFVFGYYMRNISNKDILSVVNREIKMSSQIITSIQENIDRINNPKIDIGYKMVAAHNIGGEFIDMIRLTATRHLFVVGDLSGKGIAASMNMVILKSIIRTFLAETHDFKQLIVKINDFIRTSLPKGTIFSGLFALIDFEKDTMYYINCGTPTLMMYTQVYNNVIEIQGSGHILGFVKDISPFVTVKTTKLNPGDIILSCTDGLVKSHSLRGEQFGKERIQQAILNNSTYTAQRMAQFTFDGLIEFMSKEMEDDVSILVLKYEPDLIAEEETNEVEQTEDVEQTDGLEQAEDSSAISENKSFEIDEKTAFDSSSDTYTDTQDFNESQDVFANNTDFNSQDLSDSLLPDDFSDIKIEDNQNSDEELNFDDMFKN